MNTSGVRVKRAAIAVGLGAIALSLLAACGASAVSADEVEEKVTSALTEQVGQAPDDVTCPEELPAEEGAEMTCELTAGGDTLGVTVTVKSVEGGTVNFDIAVDEMPAE